MDYKRALTELNKMTKDQLINHIMHNRSRQKHYVSEFVRITEVSESRKKKNQDLEIKNSELKGRIMELEKQLGQAEGYCAIKDNDLAQAHKTIKEFAQQATNEALKKFNEFKESFVKQCVDEKVSLEYKRLEQEQIETIFKVFEEWGYKRSDVMKALENIQKRMEAES